MRQAFVALVGMSLTLAACSARADVEVGPQAAIVGSEAEGAGADRVWVCHQGRWQEVGSPAAGAHGRHGDRVSTAPREARASC
jgi:hypothetical protein